MPFARALLARFSIISMLFGVSSALVSDDICGSFHFVLRELLRREIEVDENIISKHSILYIVKWNFFFFFLLTSFYDACLG